MRNTLTIALASCLIGGGLTGPAWADPIDYDMTHAGASSPSSIRPGEIVSALDSLVLSYNNGMSWAITLGDDPVRVLDTNPVPQTATLGELISHSDSSYVIYDRLAVRAVVQWIGYDNGMLSQTPTLLAYWTDEGLFTPAGQMWIDGTSPSGTSANTSGGGSLVSVIPIPEPSTLAIAVIAGSAVMSLFRRRRYGAAD
ncbi:MAG: PEP-CTERM sorting domain-containing protein [Phycisphaerales bacterium]